MGYLTIPITSRFSQIFAAAVLLTGLFSACSDRLAKPPGTPLPASPRALDINSADEEAFARLPGIGPATAAKIVAHREKHGPFRKSEHLMLVDGVSEGRFRAVRDLVVVR